VADLDGVDYGETDFMEAGSCGIRFGIEGLGETDFRGVNFEEAPQVEWMLEEVYSREACFQAVHLDGD